MTALFFFLSSLRACRVVVYATPHTILALPAHPRSAPPPASTTASAPRWPACEGQIVFDALLSRYSTIEPAWSDDAPPAYRDSLVLRGLESLPVRLLA